MKRIRCLASARATLNLAAMLEYRFLKEEKEMANRKTAKKKRLKEQKKGNTLYGNIRDVQPSRK